MTVLDADEPPALTDPAEPATTQGLARTNWVRYVGLLIALGILVAVAFLSVAVGSKEIPLSTVWNTFFHYHGTDDQVIVLDLRLPRTLLGLLVGMALGIAGALIQALTRNPLADPGILGVNAGAGFFVTIGVAVFGLTSIWGYIWFAFFGAVVTTTAVYAIGSVGRGGAAPVRLTLAGVALAALLGGVAGGITLLRPEVFDQMRFWGAGSLAGRPMSVVAAVSGFIVAGLVISLFVARPLNALGLGDDLAHALGANIVRTRILVVISVTLLCGAATAGAGPIGFVGLMVPHVARWFVGPDQRWILPYTLLGAPTLLLLSDIIGRIVMRPAELQVGIVTAFVGAPVLIYLIRRKKVSGL